MSKHNPDSGTFSKNNRKNKPSHPDATGSITVCCQACGIFQDMWVAGWIKDGANGRFTSLNLTYIEGSLSGSSKPAKEEKKKDNSIANVRPDDDNIF